MPWRMMRGRLGESGRRRVGCAGCWSRPPRAMKAKPIEQLARDLKLRIAPEVLERAFLHSSYSNEVGDPRGSNERLEFLGDAVIDLAVTSHLYESFPDADEGRLTKAKSVAVSRPTLAEKADELG